ncbi:MAG: TolC family protein [Sphingobacteriia bacterium]|nr:TolC family protein [Sphingobacteriia bacterium]
MTTLIRSLIINVLLAVALTATGQDRVVKLSLDEACRLAIDSNLKIINARIETQKIHFQEAEAKSKLYPTVDGYSDFSYYYAIPRMMMPGEFFGQEGEISVEIGTKFDWSTGIKASMSLVDLTKLSAIRLAKSMKQMGHLSLEQKKEEIIYQIHQLYYLSQSTSEQINYLNKNLINTYRLLAIIDEQIKNGVARKIDYANMLVNKNNLLTRIDNCKKIKEQQDNTLKYILGLDQESQIELTDSLTDQADAPEVTRPNLSLHTDIRLFDVELRNIQIKKETVAREYLPSLAASSQFYYQGQQNEFNFFDGRDRLFHVGYVGVSLNVPLFHGFERQSRIRQNRTEIEQLQNSRQDAINNLDKEYKNALAEYSNSLRAIHRQQENIRVAEENYNTSLEQYRQQVLLLSELILAENALTEARLSYVEALLQMNNSMLDMKRINGKLIINQQNKK